MKINPLIYILAGFLILPFNIYPHHSLFWYYDVDKPMQIQGIVKKYKFVNPHPYLVVEVEEKGATSEWEVEWAPAPVMARAGWNRDTLFVGEKISVSGFGPKKDGSKILFGLKVVKQDGTVLALKVTPEVFE